MRLFGRRKSPPPQPLNMAALRRMAEAVESIAIDGQVTARAIEVLAKAQDMPKEHLYAGLAASPTLELTLEHPVQFDICLGICQERGAFLCAETLLSIRDKRLASGSAAFDLVPRPCLSRCASSPAVKFRSSEGDVVLAEATPKMLTKAVKELIR